MADLTIVPRKQNVRSTADGVPEGEKLSGIIDSINTLRENIRETVSSAEKIDQSLQGLADQLNLLENSTPVEENSTAEPMPAEPDVRPSRFTAVLKEIFEMVGVAPLDAANLEDGLHLLKEYLEESADEKEDILSTFTQIEKDLALDPGDQDTLPERAEAIRDRVDELPGELLPSDVEDIIALRILTGPDSPLRQKITALAEGLREMSRGEPMSPRGLESRVIHA